MESVSLNLIRFIVPSMERVELMTGSRVEPIIQINL